MSEEQAAEAYRLELRAWLDEHLTPEVRAAAEQRDDDEAFAVLRKWNAELFDAGYAAIEWPVEHGGLGAGLLQQLAHNEEMARAGAPGPVNAIGVANIAPAIMALGTPEQQERHLRPLLRGDEIWSQGMSEPDAGSDLASLRCRAVLDGDHFVVTGQKTWNSLGHRADWCQLYVRTDPDAPKHAGITCLLVDMRTPGIVAEPITTMAGTTEFAEVFLDEARIPLSAVLGEVNGGWKVAASTLSHERAGVAKLYLNLLAKVDRLVEDARAAGVTNDPVARGPEGSVIKLAWSTTDQALTQAAVDVLGHTCLGERWGDALLHSRSLTIAGGTTEVNKNIIGERVLGLPR
jgi:alkylation response protein AidB-like acyl-CoA dehydrogenase